MEKQDKNASHSPTIYTEETMHLLQNFPILDDGQIYIYAMLNSLGNVKIGKTTNIHQRVVSLSGSNGGGSKIVSVYLSPTTWVHSIEKTCHNHYHFARISGTEWFDGCKVEFDEVVEYVNGLFYTDTYEMCNELRKRINDNKGN